MFDVVVRRAFKGDRVGKVVRVLRRQKSIDEAIQNFDQEIRNELFEQGKRETIYDKSWDLEYAPAEGEAEVLFDQWANA